MYLTSDKNCCDNSCNLLVVCFSFLLIKHSNAAAYT